MAAVSILAPPPSCGHASTVVEWLGLLDLLELEGKFLGYSLSKICKLWDVELTSVSEGVCTCVCVCVCVRGVHACW